MIMLIQDWLIYPYCIGLFSFVYIFQILLVPNTPREASLARVNNYVLDSKGRNNNT